MVTNEKFILLLMGILLSVNGFFISRTFETMDNVNQAVASNTIKIAILENINQINLTSVDI